MKLIVSLLILISFTSQAAQPRSYKAKAEFKQTHPCPATGKPKGSCPGYVIDHITPLKRGNEDVSENMQWQTKEDAKAKDRWE